MQNSSERTYPMIVMLALGLMTALPSRVLAEDIVFQGWTHQKFVSSGATTGVSPAGQLSVESERCFLALAAPARKRMAGQKASWSWNVGTSVPPTDLSQKGGDDRNLSLYFIFAPQDLAAKAQDLGIRKLLGNPEIRVLMYVWGGSHDRNTVVASPYLGARGKTIVLRPAGTGQRDETIDSVRSGPCLRKPGSDADRTCPECGFGRHRNPDRSRHQRPPSFRLPMIAQPSLTILCAETLIALRTGRGPWLRAPTGI